MHRVFITLPSIHLPKLRLSSLASICAACAFLCTLVLAPNAIAQTPKGIDPTTSVRATPLGDASSAMVSAEPSAEDALKADNARRQKALDKRTAQNDYAYGVKEHDCYGKFFVNHCLDNARTAMREERKQIRQQQLALDDEQRAERTKQRDEQTALKQAQYDAEAPQRAASEKSSQQSYEEKQRQNALSAAQRQAEAPQRAANQAAYDRKQADYQRQLEEARARGVQDAQDREQKADRYEQKQRDAAQHRAEVEARQKEAARKQQEKAQQAQQAQQQQQQQPGK
ncbi:colicin transporter [Caballeronia sp. GAWG2-1]|uniref:colicin transporter n=1 Tax=Caballeronia sp. GAWG2-1 TaxID=2921744 RepID=UPI0020287D5A|nr:colicin transporter [Caballeronia sp. GAWG2-1]